VLRKALAILQQWDYALTMSRTESRRESPVIKRFFMASLGFGLLMGMVFPFYALLFADFPSTSSLVFFSAGCLGAGLTVGLVSFVIGKKLLLDWIEIRSRGLGELGTKDAILDLSASRQLGEISDNFTKFFTVLDAELRLIRDGSTLSSRALSELGDRLSDVSGILERLMVESKGGESALGELTTRINEVSTCGLELASRGKHLGKLLFDDQHLLAELSASGREIDSTQKNLSEKVRGEHEKTQILLATVQRGESAFEALRKLQERIGSVLGILFGAVSTMEEITARSNLLAMNASIEAAHAGIKGKGFAVISGEMRKQSDAISTQTGNLKASLASISGELSGGETSIREAVSVFQELKNGTISSGEALTAMDELSAVFIHNGDALQSRVQDLLKTYGTMEGLTGSLTDASASFSGLGNNDETERARQTLSGILHDVTTMIQSQVMLGKSVEKVSSSISQVDTLVKRFNLL